MGSRLTPCSPEAGNVCKVGGARMIFSSFLSMQGHKAYVQFCPSWRGPSAPPPPFPGYLGNPTKTPWIVVPDRLVLKGMQTNQSRETATATTRHRHTDRQTDRQTDRHTNRQTESRKHHASRQTDKHTQRHTDRQADRHA